MNGIKNGFDPDTTAVLVVDIQGDFTPARHGALAVDGADGPWLDQLDAAIRFLKQRGYPIIATQDWHPPDHISFYTNTPGKAPFELLELGDRTQIMWPPHCIQGTANADLILDRELFDAVVQKGMDPAFDSYSGFFDDGRKPTALESCLKQMDITALIVLGLAMDYCVRATAEDGHALGYRTAVVEEFSPGVAPDTTGQALEKMAEAGIEIWPRLPQWQGRGSF
ncbi:MAG: isochorismatase family protein [Desulfobacterales bacterium]|nr:isochorismatase family protein [Desulfobacterales bacterium]